MSMSQYMISVHSVDGVPNPAPDVMQRIYRNVDSLNDELRAANVWVFAGGLHPVDTATVVRVQDGETLVTDGPFAEGKEHIGGFWVIEAADLDAALAWAAKATRACEAPVEVRPFQDVPS
jgi:hypothetical protein